MSSDLISYFEVYTLIFGLLSLVGSNPTPATLCERSSIG